MCTEDAVQIYLSGVFAKLRKDTIGSVMSLRPPARPSSWNTSAPTEQISTIRIIWIFLEYTSRKLKFH